jgi:imidazolonepropionase-like amidohydrolase
VVELIRRFHEAGGVIALGTDYNTRVEELKPDMFRQELALYHAAGLSLMEVIQTATKNAAQACGKAKELGTVEPGKLADIVIVKGDPLTDLEVLANVMLVIKGGKVAFRADCMPKQD